MSNYLTVALILVSILLVGCEPPRRGQQRRGQTSSAPPPPSASRAGADGQESLASDPNLRNKIVGIWTNSTGPQGTGTTYSFMNSGEFQSSASAPGGSPNAGSQVVTNGKWEMAGDNIRVKITPSAGGQEVSDLYKVQRAEADTLILIKNQREFVPLFRQ